MVQVGESVTRIWNRRWIFVRDFKYLSDNRPDVVIRLINASPKLEAGTVEVSFSTSITLLKPFDAKNCWKMVSNL